MARRIFAAVVFIGSLFGAHAAVARTDSGGAADSPAIILPDYLLSGSQRSDAPIDVRFVTASDTSVDLHSLHVWVHRLIGWIDVTERLLSHPQVHVSGWGIHLEAGVLPAGEHLVRLSFHDMKGRAVEAIETIRIAQADRHS